MKILQFKCDFCSAQDQSPVKGSATPAGWHEVLLDNSMRLDVCEKCFGDRLGDPHATVNQLA